MHATQIQLEEEAFCFVLAHRTMLKAYIMAMTRDSHLAEDVFSDVTLQIVRVWAKYDRDRPFGPWARGVARRVVLMHLRRQQRQPALLDENVLENMVQEIEEAGQECELSDRKQALSRCMRRLSDRSQQLIRLRYFENRSYEDISGRTQKTVGALYVAFFRLHRALLGCVEKELRST